MWVFRLFVNDAKLGPDAEVLVLDSHVGLRCQTLMASTAPESLSVPVAARASYPRTVWPAYQTSPSPLARACACMVARET